MISAELHSWVNLFHHLELYITSRVALRKHHVEGCTGRCVHTAQREVSGEVRRRQQHLSSMSCPDTVVLLGRRISGTKFFPSAHMLSLCAYCVRSSENIWSETKKKAYICTYVLAESSVLHMDRFKPASTNTGRLLLAGVSKSNYKIAKLTPTWRLR